MTNPHNTSGGNPCPDDVLVSREQRAEQSIHVLQEQEQQKHTIITHNNHHGLSRRVADRTAATAHAMAPQGILFRRATKQQQQSKQSQEQNSIQSFSEKPLLHQTTCNTTLLVPPDDSSQKRLYAVDRPKLFTRKRLENLRSAPPWPSWLQRWYSLVVSFILQFFGDDCCYPTAFLAVLFPLTAASLIMSSATIAACLSTLNGNIQTIACGQNATELGYVCYYCLLEQWVEFRVGAGRRKALLVVGVVAQMLLCSE